MSESRWMREDLNRRPRVQAQDKTVLARWLCGLLIALAPWPWCVQAQPTSSFDEVGRFYLQNFGPEDYDAHAQNWAITQAPNGLIYVANGGGILEYDGVSWRLIPVSNGTAALSLAVGAEGRVFVGGIGELGYLAPDSRGRMRYVSLVDHIAPEDRAFSSVWCIEETSDGLYFWTTQRLFRWNGREMKVWRPETPFHKIFALNDVLYVLQTGIGLLRLDDDSLAMSSGGVLFQDKRIFGLLPQGEASYLAITDGHGIFQCPTLRHSDAPCTPFSPGLTDLLVASGPYHATEAAEGILAIATRRGGVVLLDRAGRLLRILSEASGLRDNSVRHSYVDRQGGLWLAFNNGLARVEIDTPLSYWDKTSGLIGTVLEVARHQGRLYAATSLGVYRLASAAEGTAPRFLPCPGLSEYCTALLSTPQGLLAGCSNGLYNLDLKQWLTTEAVRGVHRTSRDPTLLYLGLTSGLARMRLRAGRWTDVERIDGAGGANVYTMAEDAQGRLWVTTLDNEVLRVEVAPSDDRVAGDPVAADLAITRFGVVDGLPAGGKIGRIVAGRVTVSSFSNGRLFRLDTGAGDRRFVPDTTFDAFLSRDWDSVNDLTEDDRGRVWIAAGEASGVARPVAEGGYTWEPTALRRSPTREIDAMHVEADGSLWVGGPHGLIRYDTNRGLDFSTSFPVWIRRITTSAGSPLYDGRSGDLPPEWPYRDNTLRFAFAAPHYDAPERTHYRVRLDGLDDDWGAWVNETHKDYTDLWEGRYAFRVQARDVYGRVSREDAFAFRILPPWHRSWWAYSLYGLAFVSVVLVYLRSHREQLRRERAVNARLREVDQLKDEFLANTSHELRTPIHGITGLAESLIDGVTGELPEETKANLSMIAGSGRRLGQLVNDILDHSQIAHGSLELRRRPVDLRALVDVVLTLQRPLVTGRELELRNAVPVDLPAANADEARLEQILHNLVGNAVKFTEEGCIKVSASAAEDRLTVIVEDTGIGISKEKQDQIFKAFEQANSGVQRAFGGTGLGLTVTRELVELHGGEIGVESSLGEGTRFTFTLPVSSQEAEPRSPSVSRPITPGPAVAVKGVVPAVASVGSAADSDPQAEAILVVDDEPVNLQVLANHLTSEGYQVIPASSGPLALQLLAERTFDLVVLDVMMPKMSGYEVCRALREEHSREELPVIFLTAKNQVPDLVSGLAAGGNDYLTKPLAKDELLARVRTHLELLDVHRNLESLVAEKISQVKVLRGLLPICAGCKKIRDDGGYWSQLEVYIDRHSEASFSHGVCPDCIERFYDKHTELRPRKPSQ